MLRRSLAHEGVDGVRDGKPLGASGRYTNTGRGMGEVASAGPPGVRGGRAGCWVIAGTWPPPGVSLAPRSLSVCSCSPGSLPLWSSVRSRLPLQSSWLLKVASSTFLLLCVSLRLSCRLLRVRALHSRGCGSLLGSAGLGAWHLPALSWVPYRLPVSARLCGSSGSFWSGAWHPPTHCWLPPSRPGSHCELRCVFLICWSVVVTCSRMLYGMLWSHCLFLLFLRLLASPVGPCGW